MFESLTQGRADQYQRLEIHRRIRVLDTHPWQHGTTLHEWHLSVNQTETKDR